MTAVDIRSQHVRERSSRAIDHALLPVKIYLPVYWYEVGPGKKGRIRKLATYAVTAYTENGVRYVDREIRKLVQSFDRVQLVPPEKPPAGTPGNALAGDLGKASPR